jgi:hypothetical protein
MLINPRKQYYADGSQSHNGQQPSNADDCQKTINGVQIWEGQTVSCLFPTGVTFTSNIQSGAGGYAVGAYAGLVNRYYELSHSPNLTLLK